MKHWFSVLASVVLSSGLAGSGIAQVAPASTDQSAGGRVLGSVTNGNTTIVFEATNLSDINMQALATWSDFATAHPAIARALGTRPSLMNNTEFLKKHGELRSFFQAHPEVHEAMVANPGNFVVPRSGG